MNVLFRFAIVLAMMISTLTGAAPSFGQVSPGQAAPEFTLKDLQGNPYHLSDYKSQPMLILYFFDPATMPSQEGLRSLNKLVTEFDATGMAVWGITASSQEAAAGFDKQEGLTFPVLLDTSNVSDLYQARLALPTVCILGPELKVLKYLQGGGKGTEKMLLCLAENTLLRNQTMLTKAIADAVIEDNPQNVEARTVKGYAEIEEGNLENAEEIFQAISQDEGAGEVVGTEGLSAVYASRGDTAKAMQLAKEVLQKAPERAYPHVVQADILYRQDKKSEAEAEYQKAVESDGAEPYQKSVALNRYGRFNASLGNYTEARVLYDQAIDVNPYYIEAMSNKGMTYEKEGDWEKALAEYRQAVSLDSSDTFASVLARKAEEMIALQQDTAESRRIDTLVADLVKRAQQPEEEPRGDEWTSRPMVLSFVDFQEKGGLAERDGYGMVLITQLTDELNASGRVKVVERAVFDRVLSELNIGSSELADPDTALSLGRVLAANLMATGTLMFTPGSTLINLRLIDTETSAIPKVVTDTLNADASLSTFIYRLNRELLKTIIEQYPLRGYIVQRTGDEVMLNIGQSQGVVQGTRFKVVEEQKPVEYNGKMLQTAPRTIGEIEVVSVETGVSSARILNSERMPEKDDKVTEIIEPQA